MNERAFFIDRDGVVNRMTRCAGKWDSPQNPEDVRLVEGIVLLLGWLNSHGIMTVEISNRPEVAKGKMNRVTSDAIEARVHALLAEQGVQVDHKYICIHYPEGLVPELALECECRKPKPGLLLQAARELNIDLAGSVFLGDKASDVGAGKAAGVITILYQHTDDELQKVEGVKKADANYKVNSLRGILPVIKGVFRQV